MTEKEYELKNTKSAKGRIYILVIAILVSVLTSFHTASYIGSIGFLINITGSLFFGLLLASNSMGLNLTSKTPLQWIFSFSLPLVFTFALLLSAYLIEAFSDDGNYLFKNIIVRINALSLALSFGFGIFVSFDKEIERIAKIIRSSKPERENILKIEGSRSNSN